jgi:hypothetical protein
MSKDPLVMFNAFVKSAQSSLKPCPFCGSTAKAEDFEDGMGYDKSWDFRVVCTGKDCGAEFHVGLHEPRYSKKSYEEVMEENIDIVDTVVTKWNKRAK